MASQEGPSRLERATRMFQLYDRTRRRISIALFFLLCIAPTAAVIAWCVQRQLPGYAQGQAARLGRQLGAKVELDAVLHTTPHNVIYEGLRVCDPETGRPIFRCPRLAATTTDGTLALSAATIEVQSDEWDQAWAVLDRVASCRAGWTTLEAGLHADQVVLRTAGDAHTFDQVGCRIQIVPAGSQIEFSFRVAGVAMPEPARFRIVRNRRADPPETGFEWSTGNASLPCSVLPPVLGFDKALGPQSRLSGAGWANRTADGWAAEATGRLSFVDLDRLVTSRLPHTLGGQAKIDVKSAKIYQGRIQEFWAAIQAGPGVVGRSLLDAAVGRFALTGPETVFTAPTLPYEQLSVEFFIDSRGLQFRGQCDDRGTIFSSQHGPLLTGIPQQPMPLAALLNAIAPGEHPHVPATAQVAPFLARLPLSP